MWCNWTWGLGGAGRFSSPSLPWTWTWVDTGTESIMWVWWAAFNTDYHFQGHVGLMWYLWWVFLACTSQTWELSVAHCFGLYKSEGLTIKDLFNLVCSVAVWASVQTDSGFCKHEGENSFFVNLYGFTGIALRQKKLISLTKRVLLPFWNVHPECLWQWLTGSICTLILVPSGVLISYVWSCGQRK